ncbi:hypothetical protein N9L90_01115 [Planctomycetota bacterium]|nr:hypothetical protein [Planctomycetota bacterium]
MPNAASGGGGSKRDLSGSSIANELLHQPFESTASHQFDSSSGLNRPDFAEEKALNARRIQLLKLKDRSVEPTLNKSSGTLSSFPANERDDPAELGRSELFLKDSLLVGGEPAVFDRCQHPAPTAQPTFSSGPATHEWGINKPLEITSHPSIELTQSSGIRDQLVNIPVAPEERIKTDEASGPDRQMWVGRGRTVLLKDSREGGIEKSTNIWAKMFIAQAGERLHHSAYGGVHIPCGDEPDAVSRYFLGPPQLKLTDRISGHAVLEQVVA